MFATNTSIEQKQPLKWTRLGQLYRPENDLSWSLSYGQVPRCLILEDRVRVYFSVRGAPDADEKFTSRIRCIDLDIDDPTKILNLGQSPCLDVGEPGGFDEFGVMPGCIITKSNQNYMYYTGWSRPKDYPFSTSIGLAVSNDNGITYSRYSEKSILNASAPKSVNGPFVMFKNNQWHMWYSYVSKWISFNNKLECYYDIRYANSADGLTWSKNENPCIPPVLDSECQNAPFVFELNGYYHMYFCYRYTTDFRNSKRGYRLGYAVSSDLKTWHRNDEQGGISLSADGWDSEMMCYPSIAKLRTGIYLFYCGNNFGKDGFGLARLNES